MRNCIKKLLYSFLLLLILSKCTYKPSEKYFVDLQPPGPAPDINFNLNLKKDTINFYWASTVKLRIINDGFIVKNASFFLDEKEVSRIKNDSLFCSSVNPVSEGTHKFRMIITTGTGTNSIADHSDAETYVYNTSQYTFIRKTVNPATNISYRSEKNGLALKWAKYDGINFKCYRIKEAGTGFSYDISDSYSDHFAYTNYVGEACSFYLYVVDNEGVENLWGKCDVKKSLPVLRIGSVNNHIALIWSKPAYIGGIKEYQVFMSDWAFSYTQIGTLQPQDTAILINTKNTCGLRVSFYIYCVPAYNSHVINPSIFSSSLEPTYAAVPIYPFENIIWSDCSGFYFFKWYSTRMTYRLYWYNFANDNVSEKLDYNQAASISPDGKTMVSQVDSNLVWYDIASESIKARVNIVKLIDNYAPQYKLKVSDNGVCFVTSNSRMYAIDIMNGNIIASKSGDKQIAKVTGSGKYFFSNNRDSINVYSVSSGSISFLSGIRCTTDYNANNYDFIHGHDDQLYIVDPTGTLTIRSTTDLNELRRITIAGTLYNIDFCTNRILTSQNPYSLNIYDFTTGQLVKILGCEIPANDPEWVAMENNIIYFHGYKYFVDN